ncbi:MAG: hypothetical protein P1V35_10735 [Planctomycetota bacterium]|nr:hypothetical protein [Planctomycetota bacterium]
MGRAQQPTTEGPLRNDTFVPTDKDSQALLLRGDKDLQKARSESSPTLLAAALDAWQSALTQDNPTVWVQGKDPAGIAQELWGQERLDLDRMLYGVQAAIAHRLQQLDPGERKTWTERFSPLAEEALHRNPFDPAHLRRIEHRFPLTQSAAVAGLRLADIELERDHPKRAQTWLDRAAWHLGGTLGDDTWDTHLKARGWRAAQPASQPTPANIADLKTVRAVRLEARPGRPPHGETPTLGLGLMPGLAPMDDGSIVVQTPRAVLHLSEDFLVGRDGAAQAQGLTNFTQEGPLRPLTPGSSGGWPLTPVTRGTRAYLVVDRARSGAVRYGLPIPSRSNHLLALQSGLEGQFSLLWKRSTDGVSNSKGQLQTPVDLQGAWEFQPGLLLVDNLLICVARAIPEPESQEEGQGGSGTGEAILNLVAMDANDGSLVYSVPFAKASDLVLRDESSVSQGIPTVCMPPSYDPRTGQILVASHHGLITTFDATDGRPRWSFRTRRRNPRDRGWPGSRPAPIHDSIARVAPFDGDFLYRMNLDRAALSPLLSNPTPIGQRLDLVHADATGTAFLGRRGRHETFWFEPAEGAPQYSIFLGRQEHLTGTVSRTQSAWLFASTQGLYVLDPTRQWALSHHFPLEDMSAGVGGDVYTIGERVFVLGEDTLWVLQ